MISRAYSKNFWAASALRWLRLYLQQTVAVAALFGSLGIVYSTVTAQQTLPASSIGTSAVPMTCLICLLAMPIFVPSKPKYVYAVYISVYLCLFKHVENNVRYLLTGWLTYSLVLTYRGYYIILFLYLYESICLYMSVCIYIYIDIERERGRHGIRT